MPPPPVTTDRAPPTAWRYLEWRPPELGTWIDLLWGFEGPTVTPGKRVLPNGRFELLVNLAAPYRIGDDVLPAACLSGNRAGPQLVLQPPRQNVIGARLTPAGAVALMATTAGCVGGLSVDLGDVLADRRDAGELVERCAAASTMPARLRALAGWLGARLRRGDAPDPAVAWAVAAVERAGGQLAVAALGDDFGAPRHRLRQRFTEQVGLAPKRYARVMRLRRAIAALQSGTFGSLADLAAECGFADQPHMNAELRALAGTSPTQFLAARHPVGDGSTIAESR